MFDELRAALHATSLVGLALAASMLVPGVVDLMADHPAWIDFIACAALTGICANPQFVGPLFQQSPEAAVDFAKQVVIAALAKVEAR